MIMELPRLDKDFRVTSVTRTKKNWYAYTISNNTSTIRGQRSGTHKQVNQHAEDYSRQLNERLRNNVGYYSSAYQQKRQAAAAKKQ